MKNGLIILSVLVGLLFAINAQAQVRFGVTGGVLLNKVNVNGVNVNADNYTGWYAGPTLEVGIPHVGIKIDGSVLYTRNGVKYDNMQEDADYVSIPLNLKLMLGSSKMLALYIAGGPQFDYVIGENDADSSITFKKNQLSFNVGGGLRLLKHLQIGAYYNIPTGDATEPSPVFKNNMWKVNLLVLF